MNRLKYHNSPLTHTKPKPMTQEFTQTVVSTVANQGAKIGIVWISIGVTSWAEAASFMAFVLSALALCEYLWKKAIRPMGVRLGYCKPRYHRIKLIEVVDEKV